MLQAGTGDIYGIPRAEWMKLQVRQQPCRSGRWNPRAGGQAAKDRQLPDATPWGADAGCTEATHAVLGQPSWWGVVTYSAGAVDARPPADPISVPAERATRQPGVAACPAHCALLRLASQSPARYLGNEFGAVHKPWEQAEIRFALTYPEIYEGRRSPLAACSALSPPDIASAASWQNAATMSAGAHALRAVWATAAPNAAAPALFSFHSGAHGPPACTLQLCSGCLQPGPHHPVLHPQPAGGPAVRQSILPRRRHAGGRGGGGGGGGGRRRQRRGRRES